MPQVIMQSEFLFLVPMALTVVLEVLTAFLLGIRRPKQLLLVVLVNVLTNPLLHLFAGLLYRVLPMSVIHVLIYAVLEPLVILTEGRIYEMGLEVSHPYRVSFIMNLVTITGGLLWMLLSH